MFACRLVNLTSKFELFCNKVLISHIIEHNSDLPGEIALMASTTTLESLSKIILDQPLEEASRIASKIAIASPSWTERLCLQLLVPAAMKEPSELRTHQLHPEEHGL
ncbi:hypothetical protein QL285_031777 [Trifolium repens]|nr:hypothetical protein QL285_031777 [Trifolium repens]